MVMKKVANSTDSIENQHRFLLTETRNEGREDITPAAIHISTGIMFDGYNQQQSVNQQQSGEMSTMLTPLSRVISGQGQIRVYTTSDEFSGGGNLTVYSYPDGSDIARPYTGDSSLSGYASSSSWSGRQKRKRDAEQNFIQFADQQQFQGTYFTDLEDFTTEQFTNAPEKATGIAPTTLGNPQYRTMEAAEETGGKGKGYKGVRQLQWEKWGAEITDPRKGSVIWIGAYDTAEEAATAYDNAALELIGDRARLNFPVALAPSLQAVGNVTVAAPPQVRPPPQLPISNSPAIRYSMTPPPQPTLQLPISSSPTIRNSRTPPPQPTLQLPISNSLTIPNSRTPQPLQPPRQLQNFSTPTIRNPRTPRPQPPPQLPIYNPPTIRNSRTPQPLQPPRQLQNFSTPTICNPRTPPSRPPLQLPNYNPPTIRNSRTPQPLQPPRQLQHVSSPTIPYPIIPTARPPPQLPVYDSPTISYPTTPPPRPSTRVLISNSPITPQPGPPQVRPPTQMLISSSPTCHDAITPGPRPLQLQPPPQMAICSSPRTFVPITPQFIPPQLQLPLSPPSSNSPTIFSSMTPQPQPPQFHQTQQEQISQHYPGCSEYYPLFLDDTDDFLLQERYYSEYNRWLLEDTDDSLVLELPDYLGLLYDDSTLPAAHSQPPVSSFSVPSSSCSCPQQFSNQQNVHLSFPNTQNQGDGSNVQGFLWDTSHNFLPFSG